MRWLGIGVALAVGVGVLAYALDQSGPDGSSGVRGIVLAGPACPGPVAPPLPPDGLPLRTVCPPERPVAITMTVTDERGRSVATVTSGPDGRFAVALAAGSYTFSSSKGLPFLRPTQITVPYATWIDAELHADTGIR